MAPELELSGGRSIARDRDPRAVYLASLSTQKSRRAMAGALERIARVLGAPSARVVEWAALRYQHTQAIRARLIELYAATTANHALAALRGVLREAARLGLAPADELARACDLRPARGSREPAGRALEAGEIRAMIAATRAVRSNAAARDGAIVSVLYTCGLRRAELVALDVRDYERVAGELRVRGKGNKERRAFVADSARAIDAWLVRRGDDQGPLFLPVDRHDVIRRRRLTDQAVLAILQRLAQRAGIGHVAPHDLRRTFVSHLLDAGVDVVTVSRMAGHAKVQTTERYDRRGDAQRRRAATLLQIEGRHE